MCSNFIQYSSRCELLPLGAISFEKMLHIIIFLTLFVHPGYMLHLFTNTNVNFLSLICQELTPIANRHEKTNTCVFSIEVLPLRKHKNGN